MKKVINIGLWILLGVGLLTIQSFVSKSQDEMLCQEFNVNITPEKEVMFVTKKDVKREVENICGSSVEKATMADLTISEIEQSINDLAEVETAEAFKTLDGKLTVKVKQRLPIVRLINKNNKSSYYIDKKGYMMPLSSNYTAHVLAVNGAINEKMTNLSVDEIKQNDSLSRVRLLDDIYDMALHVWNDNFFRAQIQQMYVTRKREFVLIPRVGNHKLMFGKAKNIEKKFDKLKLFYTRGLNKKDWNKYKKIDLKYIDQIVCTKK